MRIWFKLIKDNRLVRDYTYENYEINTRTKKVFEAITEVSHEFDLTEPIWLDLNIRDFKKYSKTRFTADSYIESFDYDYLEIHVIEEDY